VTVFGGGYGVPVYGLGVPGGPGCGYDPDGNYCCPQGALENCIAPGGYNFVKARGKTLRNPNPCSCMEEGREGNPIYSQEYLLYGLKPSRYHRTRRALGL
jgi:hypothetical protein